MPPASTACNSAASAEPPSQLVASDAIARGQGGLRTPPVNVQPVLKGRVGTMLAPLDSVVTRPHARTAVRMLYRWPQIQVGRFDCWPDDARWRRKNRVEEGHVIAFPGRAVEITQDGDRPTITDPHRLVFYNRHQAYRRALVSRDGDHCLFLVVSPDLLDEIARSDLARIGAVEHRPFAITTSPSRPEDYLEMQAIAAILEAGSRPDLEIQERLVRLVTHVVSRLPDRPPRRRARRAATLRAHEELVERARAILAADPYRPLALEDIARALAVSVFHLSHVFAGHTGLGLHAYRDELRLRGSLEWVLDESIRLTDVALTAGYASSSHFSDRFRRLYGVAPSRVRAAVRVSAAI